DVADREERRDEGHRKEEQEEASLSCCGNRVRPQETVNLTRTVRKDKNLEASGSRSCEKKRRICPARALLLSGAWRRCPGAGARITWRTSSVGGRVRPGRRRRRCAERSCACWLASPSKPPWRPSAGRRLR